jgi:hypothetical protein
MTTAQFSVDASSVLQQCEAELDAHGPAAIGLRFGCREIRRHLYAIGQVALRLNDAELTEHLVALSVLRQS